MESVIEIESWVKFHFKNDFLNSRNNNYLIRLLVFVSSFYSEHNCLGLTNQDTFACEVVVLYELDHNIWPVLPYLGHATESKV